MSKSAEIIALANEARAIRRTYALACKDFVEALSSAFEDYLETRVYCVSSADAHSSEIAAPKSAWDSIDMKDDDFLHFGLAFDMVPGGQYIIPLFFRKVRNRYELHIDNDSKRKTFWVEDLNADNFQPFFAYLFLSIKDNFEAIKNFPETKPIVGFNQTRILNNLEIVEGD